MKTVLRSRKNGLYYHDERVLLDSVANKMARPTLNLPL